jgi:hypothetical protein
VRPGESLVRAGLPSTPQAGSPGLVAWIWILRTPTQDPQVGNTAHTIADT